MTTGARLKAELYRRCGSAMIVALNGRLSHWAGLQTNPWLPVKFYKDKTTVFINGQDWMIDPEDWEVDGGNAVMYKIIPYERKYVQKKVRGKRGKYNKKPKTAT